MTPPKLNLPDDHEARLRVARNLSSWMLGDHSWADILILAYFYPKQAQEQLDEEMAR